MIQAVLNHPQKEGMPISFTINFMGPMDNKEVEVKPTLLRNNRSNQHWRIELWQGESIQCSATSVFAKRHETWESLEVDMPQAQTPDTVTAVGKFPGMPRWVGQYDMRFIYGGLFQPPIEDMQAGPSESLFWISDKPARKLDYASVTAMSDAFFPRLFIRRQKISPMGTVSLTINFHISDDELQELETTNLLGHASATRFTNGYFEQKAELWSPDGILVATSCQMVYYKD
jgi:acyl-CoA thioesterase